MSLEFLADETSGRMTSVKLFGTELLDPTNPSGPEIMVNDRPVSTRQHPSAPKHGANPHGHTVTLKGESFVNFWAGAGFAITRIVGGRPSMKWKGAGVQYWIKREEGDVTQIPAHGPGGPFVEAPLWVDAFSVLNWNWKFWGDDTRMIFASAHSSGPDGEWGHTGYDNDAPEVVKNLMKSPWRRTYPGTMAIHGGVFYNAKTGHWIALTCRQAHIGYAINLDKAGRGVGYDFTLHTEMKLGEMIRLPEIVLYYGSTEDEMKRFLAEYITFYYEEPPEWVFKTHFTNGLAWDNKPTWREQGEYWEKQFDAGLFSGVGYSLVTQRPVMSGTSPTSYAPDHQHGSTEEFKKMCHRLADKGVPTLIWMSHSGLLPGATEVDDDWFIRGMDGKLVASWGDTFQGMYFCNPGHPGYIEYTKKWIRFYIKECRCKGIFFDCYGFIIPPDFRARSFMRYPADTNVLSLKFMREIYDCMKECDPESIILGEGVSIEGPVNIFSVHSNPHRAVDGMGPRDFFLSLSQYGPKRVVIDQGPDYQPGAGISKSTSSSDPERSKFMTKLLKEKGGRDASIALPGDLSILADYLFVAPPGYGAGGFVPDPNGGVKKAEAQDIRLPGKWSWVKSLRDQFGEKVVKIDSSGMFVGVPAGIYRMEK